MGAYCITIKPKKYGFPQEVLNSLADRLWQHNNLGICLFLLPLFVVGLHVILLMIVLLAKFRLSHRKALDLKP